MYHLTKVHDSHNVQFACKNWDLKSTDIMQGVVFGTRVDAMGDDDRLMTRFDVDQAFGTAINRFCAQAAIGLPITPYGKGGQTRGFLPLRDSIQCFTLALENPPKKAGEYRVFNQFEETYSIVQLAEKVSNVATKLGLNPKITHLENPRMEKEEHYFNPDHQKLIDLGYQPTNDMKTEIEVTMKDLLKNKSRIEARKESLFPDIRWDGTRAKSEYIK